MLLDPKLKEGYLMCCLYQHQITTAVVVNETRPEILSPQESAGDVICQCHPLLTSRSSSCNGRDQFRLLPALGNEYEGAVCT